MLAGQTGPASKTSAAISNTAQRHKREALGQSNNTWDKFGGVSPKKQPSQKKSTKDAPAGAGGAGPFTGPNQSKRSSGRGCTLEKAKIFFLLMTMKLARIVDMSL